MVDVLKSTLTADECLAYLELFKGDQDFLEKHGAWVLTIAGLGAGCFGTLVAYFLKSRCKKIKLCGLECDREVVALDVKDVEAVSS